MIEFRRVVPTAADRERMDAMADRVLFQTPPWLDFVARTQDAEPAVAEVHDAGRRVGWFTGLVVARAGVRILGSPFPGWTTPSMGFNLEPGVPRAACSDALATFAFRDLRCLHLEVGDRCFAADAGADLLDGRYRREEGMTFEVDLGGDEDAVFGRMTGACRRAVRKGARSGLVVEEAAGPGFAEEYHDQLREVFARQALVPTYGVDRVQALVDAVGPTGRLLLLRVRDPDGRSIATGIFPAFNGTAYFWGGASRRDAQILRPNETMFWYAMRWWRARGVHALDMVGGGEYKRRYGAREVWFPTMSRSRVPGLPALRRLAAAAARRRQRLAGRSVGAPSDAD